jgi:hypothetical protein
MATRSITHSTDSNDSNSSNSSKSPLFQFIVASDILLYVSAYPALVSTLNDLFLNCGTKEFVMAWNRRLDCSQFFQLSREAGFYCYHHGECIYSLFRRSKDADHPYMFYQRQEKPGTGPYNTPLPCV